MCLFSLAGFGAASLFGFGSIIKLLTGHSLGSPYKHVSVGYGGSDYGGKNEVTASGAAVAKG
jgi:hypothetical protein